MDVFGRHIGRTIGSDACDIEKKNTDMYILFFHSTWHVYNAKGVTFGAQIEEMLTVKLRMHRFSSLLICLFCYSQINYFATPYLL